MGAAQLMTIRTASKLGAARAMTKHALGPPTQVDQFVADVESGKDVPPEPSLPPASGACPDGTTPLQVQLPTPSTAGSTVGGPHQVVSGDPPLQPPPSMGALRG